MQDYSTGCRLRVFVFGSFVAQGSLSPKVLCNHSFHKTGHVWVDVVQLHMIGV